MTEPCPDTDELPENNASSREDAEESPAGDSSPAEVFEHLARIRGGISNGVITPW
jgi:hypothetical protein